MFVVEVNSAAFNGFEGTGELVGLELEVVKVNIVDC